MLVVHPKAQALIFDCDGTLADTLDIHWEAWHETFAAAGVTCSQEFLESTTGSPTTRIVADFNKRFGHTLDVEQFSIEKELRVHENLSRVRPIRPVVELVHQYMGRLPMAVASGGSQASVMAILFTLGLQDHFSTIITADDPVEPKPSPDIFLEAARRLSAEPKHCQVFEDGDFDIEAAHKAGMIVTDVRPYI
jgi:HAD superfamily hydrolase (TIGR01509 family)